MKRGRRLFRYSTCSKGAAAVEFALIAPVFFLILIGIVEVSYMLFAYAVLEGATSVGSRIGKTGYTDSVLSREEYIRSEVERLSGGFLNQAKLNIDIISYDNFDDVGKPEPCITSTCAGGLPGIDFVDKNCNGKWDADQGKTGAGTQGAVVLYKVTYPWSFFTKMFGDSFGNSSIFNIQAIATVKNEQFGGGGGC